MGRPMSSGVDRLLHKRMLRRWTDLARQADQLDLSSLRSLRSRARELRGRLDKILYVAEGRLALPEIGSNAIPRPLHTDWAYRPEPWRGPVSPIGVAAVESKTEIGSELKVFHDCAVSELTLRQVRNRRESDLAPFGLRMDVFRFDGSFLSLVLELPDSGVAGLSKRHLVRVSAAIEAERPLDVFVRLNVRHGPNTEQIVRELPLFGEEPYVDFDLAYTELNEKRVEHMWLDLIFEGAEMNQILIRDVTLTRRPRAEL